MISGNENFCVEALLNEVKGFSLSCNFFIICKGIQYGIYILTDTVKLFPI